MLHSTTLQEISSNPGVEYEIALFYKLLHQGCDEATAVMKAINSRQDAQKTRHLIEITDEMILLRELQEKGLSLIDVSFETQNDSVGPADIVLYVSDTARQSSMLGLSVKYANRNTLNPTAKRFISEQQIKDLQDQFDNVYIHAFLKEMKEKYGHVSNWKRKRSDAANKFYDLMRDAVIENWPNVQDKVSLLAAMFHSNSPIPFWVINYTDEGYTVETEPDTVDEKRVDEIVVEKYKDAFVAFKLDGKIIGKVQVKCNNGFIEDQFNHAGKAKKKEPDFIIDGQPRIKGKPFGSWDFTLGK